MKATNSEVVQIRLVTGDEILCTFSDDVESDENSFMVHSILQMIPLSDVDPLTETESYILRPYITYTDNLQRVISLNPVSVVCLAYPSRAIEAQYYNSLAEIEKQMGHNIDYDMDAEDETIPPRDSNVSNVVSFPSHKKLLTED